MKEKPLGTASGIIILILIFVAIFADVLAPYPYWEVHLINRLQGSSSQYLLGTDQLGRDFLSRLIVGARLSLGVGLAATAVNVVVALLPGLCLTIVVFSFNMFGDAMRDLLDPRLRGGQGSYGIAKVKRKRGLLARLLSPFNQ